MNAIDVARGAVARLDERANPLENIVLQDRTSILFLVYGEDAAYVVGTFADIRGIPVSTTTHRVDKSAIALRIQITAELRGNPDTLGYSQRAVDNS